MHRAALFFTFAALLLSGGFKTRAADVSSAAAAPAATSTIGGATGSTKVPPPQKTPAVARILKAMASASTWGHPDLFGQFNGLRRLFDGDYAAALRLFKIGARNADKFSQNSIGMMYYHGRGVAKDPVIACAWLALAAERETPKFVKAHDGLCAMLTPAQHAQAAATLAMLMPEYGDKVAKQRMTLALVDARRMLTGSHVGYDFGVRSGVSASDPAQSIKSSVCDEPVLYIGGVAVPSRCGTYDPAFLNSKQYFAARDAPLGGTVTVGALQKVDAPDADNAAKPQRESPELPPASRDRSGR